MNILITGTSSGIGNGLAKAFLNAGDSVWGISRRMDHDLIKKPQYKHLQLDLTEYKNVATKLPHFVNNCTQFDLIILNAGILEEIKWVKEQPVADMKKVMEINVWANKVLLDELFKQDINIKQVVAISSGASLRSTPGWAPYSISKAALNLLIHAYAIEFQDTHFTALAPGLVDTEIQEYIYNVPDKENYPAAKRLSQSRYTPMMPDPDKAAPKLIEGMQKALEHSSGSYLDIREM